MPQTRIKWVERVRWQSLEGLALDLREDILDKLPHLDESPLLNKLLVISRDPLEPIDFEVLAGTNETSSRMPFREFVRWVIRENFLCINDLTCLRNIDQHWRPQYVHCAPCANSYDIISKVCWFTTKLRHNIKYMWLYRENYDIISNICGFTVKITT